MKVSNVPAQARGLPIRRGLTAAHVLSLVAGLLMAVASLAGLYFSAHLYPTEELRRAFLANDVVNLVVGLPALLASVGLARLGRIGERGRLLGLLLWPGALFYVVYNALIYVLALPLNAGLLLAVGELTVGVYSVIGLVTAIDGEELRRRLSDSIPKKLSGGIMALSGILFFLLAVGTLVSDIVSHAPMARADLAVHVSDAIISPAWIIVGLLLWRDRPLGYVAGGGLLFQLNTLFLGLVIVLAIQPRLTGGDFPLADIITVAAMGLVTLVPLLLFLRGLLVGGERLDRS